MILDSSAVISILLQEQGYDDLLEKLITDPVTKIGAPTLVETGIVLTHRVGLSGKSLLARFLTEAAIETVPLTEQHWPIAIDAFLRYGTGRHPAALTFGDCLTYATTIISGEPLLCVGDDFPQTDLPLATRHEP